MSKLVLLVGEQNLYMLKRMRFSPARNYSIVTDKHGRKIITTQSQYEYYKSKFKNKYRAWKRRRGNG